jgi:hypothetical protein
LVEALRAKLGILTGTRSLADLGGPGLVWRPMLELAPLEHFVAWKAGETRPHVQDFVSIVIDAFAG